MKLLRNQKGVSLLEFLAAIPLVAMIFIPFGLGVAHLFRTMDEVRLEAQLQQEMVDALEIIRIGYADRELLQNEPDDQKVGLIGLASANEVTISTDRRRVTVQGVPITIGYKYDFDYYLQRGELLTSGNYEIKNISPTVIFPFSQSTDEVAGKPRFYAEDLKFSVPEFLVGSQNPALIDVSFTASVRFREQSEDESADDDLALNKKTVTFDMRVFLGNVIK